MTSPEEQSSQSIESLFDHIYIDHGRLSHFYAQLSEHGVISSYKRTGKETAKTQTGFGGSIKILSSDIKQEESSEDGYEHVIDPMFSRPLEVLNSLDQHGLISGSLAQSPVGGVVLIRGELAITDTRMIQEMWPMFAEMQAREQAAGMKEGKQKKDFLASTKKENDLMLTVISKLPHMLQGGISSVGGVGWFTLNPEYLSVSPEDFSLKQGSKIQGEWLMLGILDARPDTGMDSDINTDVSFIGGAMRTMQQELRKVFGRPFSHYGLTPILIFRKIESVKT